jgi:hypothetical protein
MKDKNKKNLIEIEFDAKNDNLEEDIEEPEEKYISKKKRKKYNIQKKKTITSEATISSSVKEKELELKLLEKQIELKNLDLALREKEQVVEDNTKILEQSQPQIIQQEQQQFPMIKKKRFLFFFKRKEKILTTPVKNDIVNPFSYNDSTLSSSQVHLKETDIYNTKKCPLCKTKLIRGKVIQEGNIAKQYIKCKNPNCSFQKELKFNLG